MGQGLEASNGVRKATQRGTIFMLGDAPIFYLLQGKIQGHLWAEPHSADACGQLGWPDTLKEGWAHWKTTGNWAPRWPQSVAQGSNKKQHINPAWPATVLVYSMPLRQLVKFWYSPCILQLKVDGEQGSDSIRQCWEDWGESTHTGISYARKGIRLMMNTTQMKAWCLRTLIYQVA